MSLVFLDGFDHYSGLSDEDLEKKWETENALAYGNHDTHIVHNMVGESIEIVSLGPQRFVVTYREGKLCVDMYPYPGE